MTESPPPLEVRDLHKSFRSDSMLRRIDVLRGVNLCVRTGEVVGFLGPNGAGKTTTLKVVMGLIRPTSGSARIFGRSASDPATRSRVGFLPEQPYFYDYLTVEEILRLAADLHGLPRGLRRERVERVMERVGLTPRRRTALRKLSKGWLQRVGMAQALVNDPDLLILDEPMSGLDPIGRRELRDLIRALADEGKTICLSSHILSDAELLCDRVAVIVNGRIQHEGRLDQLDDTSLRGVDVTLADIAGEDLAASPVTPASVLEREGHLLLHVDDAAAASALIGYAIGRGATVIAVAPRRASLEDTFQQAVEAGRGHAA